ncbi:hypothetical protein SCHPADRAFT_998972 [Schizopora paradoxa]|uniref:Uncharacterized protein n=1 Tax=Schizopora paradoxa TaxID=27342 RepID=A0A0H2RHF9_9AGAM|nr:hypothetical protein SCHPADRAFT_998972 [Schizopora paradoxa]
MALDSSINDEDGHPEDKTEAIEPKQSLMDLKALDCVSEIIDKLRRYKTSGRFDPEENWFNPDESFPSRPLGHNPTLAKEDIRDAKRIDETLATLRLAADTLREISTRVNEQIKISKSKARSLRLRAGISVLPDEILALILEYAAHRQYFPQRSEAEAVARFASDAISLTRVCRRFRALGLQIPCFWNRLSNAPQRCPISLRCERAASFNVEISIQARSTRRTTRHLGTGVAPFLQATRGLSQRWRRFTHGCNKGLGRVGLSAGELEDLARETQNLHAPILSELAIYYPSSVQCQNPDDVLHYYSTWTVPKLRKLVMHHLVPIPFSASSSLTAFRILLDFRTKTPSSQLKSLVTFLSASPCLRTLALSMDTLEALESFSTQNHQEIGSVDELELSLFNCEGASVNIFLDRVSFPNVSSIKLDFRVSLAYTSRREYLQDAFRYVFPNSARFPRLVSLHLKYIYSPHPANLKGREYWDVTILLSALSSVQNLSLVLRDFGVDTPGTLSGGGPCLPSLRSLTFESCSRLRRPFVAELLTRLKSQGYMPRLVVEDCRWLTSPLEDNPSLSDGRSEKSDEGSESDSSSESSSSGSRKGRHTEERSSLVTIESMLELIE